MIQNITPELAESFDLKSVKGAIVAQIDKDGPAAKSELQEGDIITAVNGKTVESSGDMPVIISAMKPGDTATLTVLRDGKSQTVKVQIAEPATMTGSPANRAVTPRRQPWASRYGA